MKKFLNALLIFALVFTMAVPAFAAVPSDVKGTDAEEAVAKLSALGVLSGYPDGTFRPDNNITRAEFAKIVAYAAGFATAAEYLGASNTQFSDVKADNWASGYIAVAANKGYLKGYPDGTFKPNNNVTYAEVVTVLLRVLGYNDNLIGSWPSNYIIQADDLDLLDDVKFSASTPATRGDVAVLTSGTLEQELVSYDKETDDFDNTGKKLISKAFATSFKDAVVLEPKLVGDDEDQISLLVNGVEKKYTAGDLDVSLAALWGHEVEFLLDDDENVVYINDVQSDDNVVTGEVTVTADVYSVELDEEEYEFASDPVIVVNNKNDVANSALAEGAKAKLFLDDEGDVRFVIATSYDVSNLQVKELSSVTTTGTAYIYFTDGTRLKVNVDDTEFSLNGEAVDYEDLDEDFIVNYVKNDSGVATIVDATFDTVTGEVEYASSKGKVKVDGVTYTLDGVAYDDFNVGEEFTLFFNADGKVVAFEQVTGTSSDNFVGFLIDADQYYANNKVSSLYEESTYLAENGNVVSYKSDETDVVDTTYVGKLVEVDLIDGKVDEVTKYEDNTEINLVEDGIDEIFTSTKRIKLDNGDLYRYNNETVAFDVTNYDPEEPDADDVATMELSDLKAGMDVMFYVDGSVVKYIVVTDNLADGAQAEPIAGVFLDQFEVLVDDGDTEYYVVLNVDGEELEVQVNAQLSGFVEGDLISLADDDEDGVYKDFTLAALQVNVASDAYDKDGAFFTIDGKNYFITDLTTIYVLTEDDEEELVVDLGSTFDIENVYDLGNGTVSFVELLDEEGKPVKLVDNDYEVGAIVVDLR